VQIGSHVLNACTHVFKALDVRVIMGLQYVRTDNAFNACKTCGHAATVRLQCSTGPAGHTQGITTMPATRQDQVKSLTVHDATEQPTRCPSHH
jgi:hypothetical protein